MIHLYCGDGKGKTTAACGLTVRAAGNGYRVLFVQFMKAGETGELNIFQGIPSIDVVRAKEDRRFSYEMTGEEREKERITNDRILQQVFRQCKDESYDVLVLDEAATAVSLDLLDDHLLQQEVEAFDASKELIITGRTPEPWMVNAADYVTDMEKIRHPYDTGTEARRGIEF